MPRHDPLPRDTRPDPLDDPAYAAHVWGRFRRILAWMTVFSIGIGVGAVAILWRSVGPLPIHMAIATFLGVTLTILMAALLMGLIFLSSGSGHDEAVERHDRHEDSAAWRDE
ncbi:hypothetical protein [uncultured Sphingomonas sp.]|uniref:hypothetical protein n=1 Tax=uncultured Sphingomonas sp. TaxID=158754 RepID=UPI0025FD8BFA|nr:hypothetical protein [uncultured Sphingomonas sp.]